MFWECEQETFGIKEANREEEQCWSAYGCKCYQHLVSYKQRSSRGQGCKRKTDKEDVAKSKQEDWEQPEPVRALLCLAGTHAPEARIWQSRPILNAEKAVFDPVVTCVVNWNVTLLSSERKQLTEFYLAVFSIAPDKRYPPASCLQHQRRVSMNKLSGHSTSCSVTNFREAYAKPSG